MDKQRPPGSARELLASNMLLIRPEDQVFEAMIRGWEVQQRSRMLKSSTIDQRVRTVRRFFEFTNEYPWRWTAPHVEAWTDSLVGEHRLAHSTARMVQNSLRLFMEYLIDPNYDWIDECRNRFGEVPVQICHEWNTVEHLGEFEGLPGNRPLTRDELQAFFDEADARVAAARKAKRKSALAAFRDTTMFKVAYAWGLRRRELTMLETVDFGRNASAPEFGRYGYLHVRYGKALRGGPPRRRTVLTTMPWAAQVVAEYVETVRPRFGFEGTTMLWPTERGSRVASWYANAVFAEIRDAAGLPPEIGPHCLRHSYVTHLIEEGWDPLFVQQQVGHAYASTTALYTGVSNDFKNRVLREALDSLIAPKPEKERRPNR